jgi:guanylate kinase
MKPQRNNQGKFIVLSSPSGGGKSTIIRRLMEGDPGLVYSVSVTTRKPRQGEKDGISYRFIDRSQFERMIESGELLEWEEVYGDFYGTPRRPAEEAVAAGRDVIFDLDVKGALKLKKKRPETLLIFLQPPSLQVLEERLRNRGTESEERIQIRMQRAEWECEEGKKFDYQVVNGDLEETVHAIREIIKNKQEIDIP